MRTQAGLETQQHSIPTTVLEGASAEVQDPATLPPNRQLSSVIEKKAGWVPELV